MPIVPVKVWLMVRLFSVIADISAAAMLASATPGIAAIVTSSPLPGAVPVVPSDLVQLAPLVGSVEEVEDQK